MGGMGMGGGTLLIPLLTLGLNVGQQSAQYINLVAFIPMSFLALAVHCKNGYVVTDKIWWVIVPASLFAVLGSFLATVLPPELLRKSFGAFLTALGIIYLVFTAVKKLKSNKNA